MGAYGNTIVKTPTLDALANNGTRFTRAYTPSPICVSARASFATGKHVHEHECWSSAEPYYGQSQSWMKWLRDRGHLITSVGKLHYRSADDDMGFSEEILPMYLANEGKGWPQGLLRNPLPDYPDAAELANDVGPGETEYTRYDRAITQATIDWLKQQKQNDHEKPWVCFASFISPHYPLSAPQEFYDLYKDVDVPRPHSPQSSLDNKHPVIQAMSDFWNYDEHFESNVHRQEAIKNYYGLCSFVDDNVKQVLAALKASGQAEDTLIIYTSDHGDLLGNHGLWCKSFMYEDSVAIPLILSGNETSVGVNNTPVSLIDLAKTIAQEASGEVISDEIGSSHSIVLQNLLDAEQLDRLVLSEYHDGGSPTGFFMLCYKQWKYVYYAGVYPPQIFDIEADPQEVNDLAKQRKHADLRNTLHEKLIGMIDPEAVNAQAFLSQKALSEQYGGREGIKKMTSFNHTPAPS